MDLFLAQQNLPFSVAILVMLGLTAVEAVSVMLGGGVSHAVDNLFHLHVDHDVHVGHAAHAGHDPHAGGLLGWLHVGKVPLLILLIIFLTAFGVSGLLIQAVTRSIVGLYWPGVVAAVPAFVLAVPAVRAVGGLFVRLVPRDETTAVSEDSLVGRVAVITVGVASSSAPAEGRVRDEHGQTHYVMVEPDIAGERFPTGTEVLLVKRAGAKFFGIRNPSAALSDRGA
jgi:hypothetical protein